MRNQRKSRLEVWSQDKGNEKQEEMKEAVAGRVVKCWGSSYCCRGGASYTGGVCAEGYLYHLRRNVRQMVQSSWTIAGRKWRLWCVPDRTAVNIKTNTLLHSLHNHFFNFVHLPVYIDRTVEKEHEIIVGVSGIQSCISYMSIMAPEEIA